MSLPVKDGSVDLVWSFGTFVHIELPEIDRYLGEVRRVLHPGGRFVIHHAGQSERRGDPNRDGEIEGSPDSGLRSEVTARQFAELTADNDLVLDRQIWRWGPQREYGLAFRDVISIGTRSRS
jgi:ubiquinone/menaquinone biosynthesis C-methylase UbiE